ncbi:hypothetical protein J0383_17515 [Flavobacterium endoglycinae]|uniref:Uncharacterized protein n=1 Tax=Flavobacterium endoglycinae TaxID=2816357 RepID=A0ABX7QCB3_9FLAO|nr:hypothetical protein [Flavobacterium endoglycinae]QSW88059.1 hypothetical protein J0383_17515 [Flavobacterium endoglycinae]
MSSDELQKEINGKALLPDLISQIEVLDIMKEDQVISRIANLKSLELEDMEYDIFINSKSFVYEIFVFYDSMPIEIKKTLEYFKIYFIQDDDNRFSICFALSSEKTEKSVTNDFFFKINGREIEKMDVNEFIKYTKNYQNKLLPRINSQTMINGLPMRNTETISYKLKDLYFFIIKHFLIRQNYKYTELYFQMIQFEKTTEEQNNRNKLSLVVRAQGTDIFIDNKGDAYDFGTVYP